METEAAPEVCGRRSRSVSALHRQTYMGASYCVTVCNVAIMRMVRNCIRSMQGHARRTATPPAKLPSRVAASEAMLARIDNSRWRRQPMAETPTFGRYAEIPYDQ